MECHVVDSSNINRFGHSLNDICNFSYNLREIKLFGKLSFSSKYLFKTGNHVWLAVVIQNMIAGDPVWRVTRDKLHFRGEHYPPSRKI